MEDERILSFQEYDFVFLRCAIWLKKKKEKKKHRCPFIPISKEGQCLITAFCDYIHFLNSVPFAKLQNSDPCSYSAQRKRQF